MKTIRTLLKRLDNYFKDRRNRQYAKRWRRGKVGASRIATLPRRALKER